MAEKLCLSIEGVARRLGVHYSTVYRLAREGVLPGFKVGGQWRFSEEMIESWIEDRVTAGWLKVVKKEEGQRVRSTGS